MMISTAPSLFPVRSMLRPLALLLALAATAAAATPASAQQPLPPGDAVRGTQLAYTCLGCHGIPNYKNTYPMYRVPKLKGQHTDYLTAALQAYRSSDRAHATMHAHAMTMSDQDIADITAYLAGTPVQSPGVPGSAPGIGTAPKAAQVCVACHGKDGVGITPQYPTLAGQYPDYIRRALTEYKKGGRKNPIMAGFAGQLTDADIEQLAEYYAAQQPSLSTPVKRASILSAR
jgi:cytochrome c553